MNPKRLVENVYLFVNQSGLSPTLPVRDRAGMLTSKLKTDVKLPYIIKLWRLLT